MKWFFDRFGVPSIIFLDDHYRFVDKLGRNIGYIYDGDKIYNYRGRHCGWIEGGVIRDLEGKCVGFESDATDEPSPIFPIPQIPPIPPIPQIPRVKPIKKFSWSALAILHLFL